MTMRDYSESRHAQHSGLILAHQPVRGQFYRNFGKRALELTLILLSTPFVLPLIAILALVTALDGYRPFYRQARVGRDGRVFHILKLRTMVAGADELLEDHLSADPDARREWDETQKLKSDPRITRFGRFLRASSLDELPQLWNVLRGDMALIGPRPMMPSQQALYPGAAYYLLRPGISGLWQVSKRNQTSFAERAWFDTEYDRTLSLRTDLSILWRTAGVVMRCTGY